MRWDFTNEYIEAKIEEEKYEHFYTACRAFLTEALTSDRWFIWVADHEGKSSLTFISN
jgi:hypothetical protein